jgi:hypothetical protein
VHTPEWIEPHTHLFVDKGSDQNVVFVDRSFKNLDSKMKHLLKYPDKAQRISENSAKIFRDQYLTPAAQACYWRRLVQAWASVSFEPHLYTTVKGKDGKTRKKIRGTSFETFSSNLVFRK